MNFPRWTRGHVVSAIAIVLGVVNIGAGVMAWPMADQLVIGIALLALGAYQAHLLWRVTRTDADN